MDHLSGLSNLGITRLLISIIDLAVAVAVFTRNACLFFYLTVSSRTLKLLARDTVEFGEGLVILQTLDGAAA